LPEQSEPFLSIQKQCQSLRGLIIQNLLQNWSSPTLDNRSNWVLEQLHEIFTGIRDASAALGANCAIDPDDPQWAQSTRLSLNTFGRKISI
jgi:hypothetical protein